MDTVTAEPTTVGEMLSEEFLKPQGITQAELAQVMGVSRKVIGQIVNNSRRLSVTEASQLAVLFQTDEDFWINLQATHDRWESRNIIAKSHFKPIHDLLIPAG
ncbi:HigA family addiction module antitoxin [Pantoea sp. FN060301]|uniref:HigA family addiction module antitoxin n=1 Tax=Pantoea sp. FN060301 TaxID=3420380 RepID=UPI003D178194